MAGTNPARCAAHGGGRRPVGAPTGNKNAKKHSFYSQTHHPPENIDDVYDGLAAKLALLDEYIQTECHEMDADTLIRLVALYAQTSSRLARILRDRAQMGGADRDEINRAIFEILREIELEKGGEHP